MFAKFFALFALVAVAFAAPNPKPQYYPTTYSGVDYVYPSAGLAPAVYSAYAAPAAYPAYPTYSAYSAPVFVR